MSGDKGPNHLAAAKIIQTAGNNKELLEYSRKLYVEDVCRGREDEDDPILTAIDDTITMAEYIDNKIEYLRKKLFDGTITETELAMLQPGYFTFHDSLVDKGLKELDEETRESKFKDVLMVYDINNESEFMRAYINRSGDDVVQFDPNDETDSKLIAVMDQAFHSWLVNNDLSSQNGVIYKMDKLDKKGQPVHKADPKKVSELLNDPVKGLQATFKNKSFDMEVRQRETKALEQKPAPVKQATSKTEAPKTEKTPKPSSGPDTQSGITPQ